MVQLASRVVRGARNQWHRLKLDDRGSILALLAVLPILAGAVAIGIETGQLYRVKRQMQSSADAAALAGALDRIAGKNLTTITSTSRYEAGRNGFTNGTGNVTVAVNAPPATGPNVSTTGAVEVIITKSTSFSLGAVLMNWLGGTPGTFNVSARSVAAQGTVTATTNSAEGCLVALVNNSTDQGVNFQNFSSFSSDCTIVSNSSATGSGSGASVNLSNFSSANLKQVWSRGTITVQNYSSITYTAATVDHQTAPLDRQSAYAVDPYSGVGPMNLPPGTGNCDYTNFTAGSATTINVTGNKIYCGGLQVGNASTVNFSPGIYIIAGGDLYISSVSTVSCPACTADNGVAFVLTQLGTGTTDIGIGGVSITSDSTINLNAGKNDLSYTSATGIKKFPGGILFYQDPRATVGTTSSTNKIFTVSSLSNATLAGAIYFPNNRIDISNISTFGGNATTGCTIWLGRYLKFSNFSSTYKGGCATYGTLPATIVTTTTTTKGKVFE